MAKYHYIPNIKDDNMIVSSMYTTKICTEHLIFLLHDCIKYKRAEDCCVSYDVLGKKWEDWREKFTYLFDVSFYAYNENKKAKVHWLEKIYFDDDNNLFFYQFSKEVWNNLQCIYKTYPEEYYGIMQFERLYTFNIFKLLRDSYGDIYCERISVQTLRDVCMLEEHEYISNTEFKRTVLGKVQNELNRLLGWNLSIKKTDGLYEFSRR